MSEKRSESREMSFTAEATRSEMRERVRSVVALSPEDGRKAALSFAAGVLGMPYARVRRLYYGDARRVEAHEADQIRAYCDAAQEIIEARQKYERERLEFLKTARPSLARLAPPALTDKPVKRRRG